jgi:hypothetical protein
MGVDHHPSVALLVNFMIFSNGLGQPEADF